MLGGGLWGAATEATSEPPNTCIQLAVLGWLRIEEVVPLPEVEGIPTPPGCSWVGRPPGSPSPSSPSSRTAPAPSGARDEPPARSASA